MTDEFKSQNINYENNMNNSKKEYTECYENSGVSNIPQHRYVTYIPYGLTPKTYEEKCSIKKTARMIGISLLIMLSVSNLWAYIYFFVMSKKGYTQQKAIEIINNPAMMQVLQIVLSTFIFTVPFIIIFRTFGNRISDLVPLEKPYKGRIIPFFTLGISFCFFARIATLQAASFFESFGINYNVDFGKNPDGLFGFLLSLISTVFVPALVEEFACRGLILGALRKYGDGFAVLVSSIIFGLMHENFQQIPFAFLCGLVFGYIVIKTGSLWISIGVHALNNLISVLFDYFLNDIPINIQNVIFIGLVTILLLIGIMSIIYINNNENYYTFDKEKTECTVNQKYKWFFSSVVIIVFISICLITAFSYFKL